MTIFEKTNSNEDVTYSLVHLKFYLKKYCIGFSYGVSFPLTLVILDYWLKDIGVSNSIIGLFTLLHWPFTLKFLWGVFVENYDIPYLSKKLNRNRSWLVISNLLLIIGIVGMANSNPESGLLPIIICASLVAIADGCKDVVLYPYQISGTSKEKLGYVAGVVGFGHRIGAIAIKVITLHMAHFFSWQIAYLTAALLIFFFMILTLFMKDPLPAAGTSKNKKNSCKSVFLSLRKSFSDSLLVHLKTLWNKNDGPRLLAILILYKGADFMMQKMSRPFCLGIGFTKLEIANVVQLFGSISVIVGGFIGGYFIKKRGVIKSMLVLGFVHMISFLSYILLLKFGHDATVLYIVILFEGLTGGGVTAVFLAFFYNLCKTGSQYALLWAFHELGGMFFMSISGIIADYLGWTWYFLLVPFVSVPSLMLLLKQYRHDF